MLTRLLLMACTGPQCIDAGNGPNGVNIPHATTSLGEAITKGLGAVFLLLGGLAVIFVIVGGLQYVISAGDPKRTAQAKDTILYSVIGLAIAAFAFAIVTFISGHV